MINYSMLVLNLRLTAVYLSMENILVTEPKLKKEISEFKENFFIHNYLVYIDEI